MHQANRLWASILLLVTLLGATLPTSAAPQSPTVAAPQSPTVITLGGPRIMRATLLPPTSTATGSKS